MINPAIAPADTVEMRGYDGSKSVTVQQTRLDEAWRALRREVPGIPERIESGDLDVEEVVDVICAAALRVLANPDAVEQESGQIDDYQESRRYADASADMYFTAAELRRLQPADAHQGGWSGSIGYTR